MSDGDLIFVTGKKRSGKTSIAVRGLVRDVKAGRNAIVFDPTGDVHKRALGKSASGDALPKECFEHIRNVKNARAHFAPSMFDTAASFFQREHHEPGKVLLVHDPDAWIALCCQRWCDGYVKFADECQRVFPNQVLPGKTSDIYIQCGNTGSRVYAVCQRPQRVNLDVRANADYVAAFRADSDSTIKALCECGGDYETWAPCGELAQHHCLVREPWTDDPHAALRVIDARTAPIPWKAR